MLSDPARARAGYGVSTVANIRWYFMENFVKLFEREVMT